MITMNFKRYWQTFRLYMISESSKRTAYLKKHKIFKSIGENVSIMDRKVPLYANLIKLHNNVHLASHVSFITHDITHVMLNKMEKYGTGGGTRIHEKVGCIEIHDNVFIGSGVSVLYNVSIGPNAIVAAGSLVNKDVPPNSVVAGVPARVIGSFDDFIAKRRSEEPYPEEPLIGRSVGPKLEEYLWEQFEQSRKQTK